MSVCTLICLCTTLPFTPTLGGGGVKTYFIIVEPDLACNIGLLGILGFNISISHGGINP